VRAHVHGEIGFMFECTDATRVIALEGLAACMCAHVIIQMRFCLECLVTLGMTTSEGSFSGVRSDVIVEVGFLAETFYTSVECTSVPLPRVELHVIV